MNVNMNQQAFQERLSRIQSGKQFVPDDVIVVRGGKAVVSTKTKKSASKAAPARRKRLSFPLPTLLLAFGIGAAALLAVRYGRVMAIGLGDPGGDILMDYLATDLAGALVLSYFLRIVLGLRGWIRSAAALLSIILVAETMHMGVQVDPESFAKVYGEEWVNRVIDSTEGETLLFNPL